MVGAGSAVGGMLRHLAGRWIHAFWPYAFPLPTLAVNLVGCLIMGMVFGYAGRTGNWGTNTLLLLTTGFCGGFTTMSAFAFENIQLMRSGAYTAVLVYITASVSLGILAAWLGLELTR
jgi:CrcB protein